jgi:hypothetical protein
MRLPAQDRRKEMGKLVSKLGEEGKVAIRCAIAGMYDHHVISVHFVTAFRQYNIKSICHAFKQVTASTRMTCLLFPQRVAPVSAAALALPTMPPWEKGIVERTLWTKLFQTSSTVSLT